jgi:hypothetical protein
LNKSTDRYIPSEKDKYKSFGCFEVKDDLSDSSYLDAKNSKNQKDPSIPVKSLPANSISSTCSKEYSSVPPHIPSIEKSQVIIPIVIGLKSKSNAKPTQTEGSIPSHNNLSREGGRQFIHQGSGFV